MITNSKLYQDAAYLANAYGKVGVCYYVLQDMLGDSLFLKTLHSYMNSWKGKHPAPYDFFYSINTGSGKNLNWFWQKWFVGWEYPDLVISKVIDNSSGTKISIQNIGGLPVPIYLDITLNTRRHLIIKRTDEAWNAGNAQVHIDLRSQVSTIKQITLGNEFIPEKYWKDNLWVNK